MAPTKGSLATCDWTRQLLPCGNEWDGDRVWLILVLGFPFGWHRQNRWFRECRPSRSRRCRSRVHPVGGVHRIILLLLVTVREGKRDTRDRCHAGYPNTVHPKLWTSNNASQFDCSFSLWRSVSFEASFLCLRRTLWRRCKNRAEKKKERCDCTMSKSFEESSK